MTHLSAAFESARPSTHEAALAAVAPSIDLTGASNLMGDFRVAVLESIMATPGHYGADLLKGVTGLPGAARGELVRGAGVADLTLSASHILEKAGIADLTLSASQIFKQRKFDLSSYAADILAGATFLPAAHHLRGSRFESVYRDAAAALADEIVGPGAGKDLSTELLEPMADPAAYRLIAERAPELAEKIDAAAATVRLPFYSQTLVRDAFSTMIVVLVVLLYTAGAVLPPPFPQLIGAHLGMSGLSVPSAYRWSRSVTEPPQGGASTSKKP